MRYLIPLIVILSTAIGCTSQVPKPTTYPLTFQQKMQAAHHWDLLAQDVARQVWMCCNEREGCELGYGRPIYVEPKPGVFGRAFRNLLIAHLVQPKIDGVPQWTGCLVAEEKTDDSLILRYDVQLIRHRTKRFNRPMPGTFTVLGAGLSVLRNPSPGALKALGIGAGVMTDFWIGSAATLPHHEVLITTSIVRDNQYLFSKTDLYYINDPDFLHYPTQDTPGVLFKVKDSLCAPADDFAAAFPDDDADVVEERVIIETVVEEKPLPGPIVYFEFDRTEIVFPYEEELRAFADAMQRHPDYDILVIGHADARGTVSYNETLSLNRARAVRAALESFGIERHRIHIYGSGKITTVDQDGEHLGRSVNRRTMVKVQARGATLYSRGD